SSKRLLMLVSDGVALPFAAVSAVWLVSPAMSVWPLWVWLMPVVSGIPMLHLAGFYRSIVRFMGIELIFAASRAVTATTLVLAVAVGWTSVWWFASKVAIAFWLMSIVYITGSRFVVRLLLRSKGIHGAR